jgi:hypothetical protein
MAEEQAIEVLQALFAIRIVGGLDFAEREGVTADCALAVDDQAARQDIRALDGDRNRQGLVVARQVILWTEHDGLAAMHVHRIVRDLAGHFGQVIFENRRWYGGFLAGVQRRAGYARRGRHRVDVARHARKRFGNAMKFADRQVELSADPRVSARGIGCGDGAAERIARQHNAAADRELLYEHAPALPRHLRPADDVVDGNEDVVTARRPVLERNIDREVPPADLDARQLRRDQRGRNAMLILVADQVFGVIELEGQAEHGRDRRERDVAFVPVEPDADDFAAFVLAAADDAGVGNRRRIRADARRGQRKAGYLVAVREPG